MSRFVGKVVKLVFGVSTLSFLALQLHLRQADPLAKPPPPPSADRDQAPPGPAHNPRDVELNRGPGDGTPAADPPAQTPPRHNLSVTFATPGVEEVRKSIEFNNRNAEIRNEDKFGKIQDPNLNLSSVIVIQVHNRANYLRLLVESLSKAAGVESTLLIFSHDHYSAEINDIIHGIDFARVVQIFYPFSIQIFPDRFPGQDPRDCEANVGKEKAKASGCLNWEWPDKYGHYRVAKFTQIKHHWWWKMNFVWEGIRQLKGYRGWVLLLEEDHYVSPDSLHVLNHIIAHKAKLCSECGVISLGFYLKSYASYGSNIAKLAVYPWFSSRHNMGMALERSTWERIRNCSSLFCAYDDYNWDWSLMRVNMMCLAPNKLTVVYAKAPRVFHVGDCGVHHKCTADTSASKVAEILSGVAGSLFPASLEVAERSKRMLRPPKENGGWGDVRDHQLCLNNTRLSAPTTPTPTPTTPL